MRGLIGRGGVWDFILSMVGSQWKIFSGHWHDLIQDIDKDKLRTF